MIHQYPHFSPLSLGQQDEIARFTARFEPYSDFNFTSLFCWNTDGTTEVALLHDNLVIRLPGYLDGHPTYSILGTNRIDESVDALLAAADKLELVPQVVVDALHNPDRYHIREDEDNFDYIYDVSHLSELAGNKFKKKRNKSNVFVKDHEHYELVVRTLREREIDENHVAELKRVDQEWVKLVPRSEGDILTERKAIDAMLDNLSAFELLLVEVMVDGEIKAFSINELLPQHYAICHFEKALSTHHEHLNTFLTIEVARKLHAHGCRWMNWEQDLGLEGLRQSKRSYHPVRMLKKYTISAA